MAEVPTLRNFLIIPVKYLVLFVLVGSLAGALHATGCSQCDEAQVCCHNQCVNASDCVGQLCTIDTDCSFTDEVCCDGVCSYFACIRIRSEDPIEHDYATATIKHLILAVLAPIACIALMYACIRYSRRLPCGTVHDDQQRILAEANTDTAGCETHCNPTYQSDTETPEYFPKSYPSNTATQYEEQHTTIPPAGDPGSTTAATGKSTSFTAAPQESSNGTRHVQFNLPIVM